MNTGTRLRCLMGSFVGDSLFDSWTDRVCVTPLKRAGDSLPLSGYLGVSRDQCNRGDCGGNYFYDFICAGTWLARVEVRMRRGGFGDDVGDGGLGQF